MAYLKRRRVTSDSAPGLCAVLSHRFTFTNLKSHLGCEVARVTTQSHRLASKPGYTFCNSNKNETFGVMFLALRIKGVPEVLKQKRDTDFHSAGNCLKWPGFPTNLRGRKGLNSSQPLWRGRTNFTGFYTAKGKIERRQIIKEPTLVHDTQSVSSLSSLQVENMLGSSESGSKLLRAVQVWLLWSNTGQTRSWIEES